MTIGCFNLYVIPSITAATIIITAKSWTKNGEREVPGIIPGESGRGNENELFERDNWKITSWKLNTVYVDSLPLITLVRQSLPRLNHG